MVGGCSGWGVVRQPMVGGCSGWGVIGAWRGVVALAAYRVVGLENILAAGERHARLLRSGAGLSRR
eukprot:1946343-Prymnesium_polylepis.1